MVGVGMLVLGIPLMLLCYAFGTKNFFHGEPSHPKPKSRSRTSTEERVDPCI